MKKYKVLFFGGGRMGELALDVISQLPNVSVYPQPLSEIMSYSYEDYSIEFDMLFSASYPGRIPSWIVKRARIGGVNIHTSLLPEGRGSNPLNWALIWGRDKTGISIHKIVDTYDAGDVCMQEEVPIFETDTIRTLRERVETQFTKVIGAFFMDAEGYIAGAKKQNQAHVTYAQKRLPSDSELNLDAPAKDIWNLWRSCDPEAYPAFFYDENGDKIYVMDMERSESGELTWKEERRTR